MSWDTEANVIAELDAQRSRKSSIFNSLEAIVGGLQAQVATRLSEGLKDGELPNYDSTTWDEKTKKDISGYVLDAYNVTNTLNPINRLVPNLSKVDATTRRMIESIYTAPKRPILDAIGTDTNFGEAMRGAHEDGWKFISQKIAEQAAFDYNRAVHGEAILAAMKKRYSLVDGKYDPEVLKRSFPQLAALDISNQLTTDIVYRIAKK